ncbi:heparin lyase I family protein [Labrys wisconsinensis]|uniref:Polysaccharide lyase-like protein n=1 Tax=Labrys wisconsinensis TaxID=425677 RepID=A0ABU0J0C6_9HYPH|nr:heparin lyase I family protein [Labrys wisconsinensis]MDQ0467724.1 hypothetical protein [Labrys wisconsinensis]
MRRLLWVVLTLACGAASAQTLRDDFDAAVLDPRKWSTAQVLPGQIDFVKPGRCGAAAVEVTVRDGDGGLDCADDCQRAELRLDRAAWPIFGDEVWYAFSFRIEAEVPSTGSARTVIGQWKAPGDNSPFLAQRFDNGVFHITVQDGEARRVVAQAEGDPDRMLLAQQALSGLDSHDPRTVAAVQSLQALHRLRRDQPDLSARFFSGQLLDSLQGGAPQAPDTKRLSDTLGLQNSALVPLFGDLSFVAEPERYLGKAEIEVTPEADRRLPDPRKGWVDMVYRIRPGRLDNEVGPKRQGEIDIWANGQKIVSVRGNIGARLTAERPPELVGPYFKFGLYRARIPGAFRFQFDEFAEAPTREGLGPLCPRP